MYSVVTVDLNRVRVFLKRAVNNNTMMTKKILFSYLIT